MNLTQEYSRISTEFHDYRDYEDPDDKAEHYFEIGHGMGPAYVVWAWIDGRIETSRLIEIDEDSGMAIDDETHGTLWGHRVTDLTYKGRFEPETGKLSIVIPDRWKHRHKVPDIVLSALERKFHPKEVFLF